LPLLFAIAGGNSALRFLLNLSTRGSSHPSHIVTSRPLPASTVSRRPRIDHCDGQRDSPSVHCARFHSLHRPALSYNGSTSLALSIPVSTAHTSNMLAVLLPPYHSQEHPLSLPLTHPRDFVSSIVSRVDPRAWNNFVQHASSPMLATNLQLLVVQ
jgi:hypothetical protein